MHDEQARHVLIEFSPLALFRTMQNALDELLDGGYRPILAHVECYACLLNCPDDASFLREMGVQLQINATALTDNVELDERRFVLRLLKERSVDYIATDAHGRIRCTPKIAHCRKIVTARCGADYAYRVMRGNAEEMLGL